MLDHVCLLQVNKHPGFCGIALPENIMALSIAIRGKRHTYHKIASSINR